MNNHLPMNRSKWSSAGYSAEWMEGRLEPLFPGLPDRTDESAVQAAQGLIRISHAAHDPVIEFKRTGIGRIGIWPGFITDKDLECWQ